MRREEFEINEKETILRYGKTVSKNEVYQEYLKNEPIELEKEITENYIRVQSDSTSYINRIRPELITFDELMDNVRSLQKMAKENNIKLKGVNLLKKFYKENYKEYQERVILHNSIFDELSNAWKTTQLFMGTADDFYYEDFLREKEFFFQREVTSIVYKIKSKNSRVLELVNNPNLDRYISIEL